MTRFFLQSYKKLLQALGICFGIFYVVMTSLLIILALVKNDIDSFLSKEALILQIPIFCLVLTFIIMLVAFFSEYLEYRRQLTFFKQPPFVQLLSNGFEQVSLFKNSLWKLNKQVHVALIDSFTVISEIQSKEIVVFTVLADDKGTIDLLFPQLPNGIKIFSNETGVGMRIPINSYWTPTTRQILDLLNQLIVRMIEKNYLPVNNFHMYERGIVREMIAKGFMQ